MGCSWGFYMGESTDVIAPTESLIERPTPHGPRLIFDVSFGMSRNIFCLHGPAALVAGTAALLFLTGCVGDMPHRGGWVAAPHNKKVEQAYALMDVPRYAVAPVRVKVLPALPTKPKPLHAISSTQSKNRP